MHTIDIEKVSTMTLLKDRLSLKKLQLTELFFEIASLDVQSASARRRALCASRFRLLEEEGGFKSCVNPCYPCTPGQIEDSGELECKLCLGYFNDESYELYNEAIQEELEDECKAISLRRDHLLSTIELVEFEIGSIRSRIAELSNSSRLEHCT